ncbi:MAG: arginine deiminase-related protein [Planctomycetes bacterium]|nr:arginine deiminase-related protein [Planctomycetota bacterium]
MALASPSDFWPRRATDLPSVEPSREVLLGHPGEFAVLEAQNAHMQTEKGVLQAVNPSRALEQWQELRRSYESINMRTYVLPSRQGLADLCFTANPSLVLACPDGRREVWLAKMRHTSRRPEVGIHEEFHRQRESVIRIVPDEVLAFEGCGDGVQHPGRFLMHAGVGPRSETSAWQALAEAHPGLDVLLYELVDPRFYHLDTALAPLDEQTALYVPEAFHPTGRARVLEAFPQAIALPLEESLRFAGNAHCPDGQHVLIDSACTVTCALLSERGYTPLPIDTSEFRKSGGSVFCLKLAL